MRELLLDAKGWRTPPDFHAALKRLLGCPDGHGSSPDDFAESMIWGETNEVAAPYKVRILNAEGLPAEVSVEIALVTRALADARLWRRDHEGTDVGVRILIGAQESH